MLKRVYNFIHFANSKTLFFGQYLSSAIGFQSRFENWSPLESPPRLYLFSTVFFLCVKVLFFVSSCILLFRNFWLSLDPFWFCPDPFSEFFLRTDPDPDMQIDDYLEQYLVIGSLKVVSGEKEGGSKVYSIDGYYCGTAALGILLPLYSAATFFATNFCFRWLLHNR